MSSAQEDMLDIIKKECIQRKDLFPWDCSDCRNQWICRNVHGPVPRLWEDV